MKAQIRKPGSGKASYSEEYKQQTLELWRASGRSAAKVAEELGIRPALIFRWSKQQRDQTQGQAARGARSLAEVEAENRRLREENATAGASRTGSGLQYYNILRQPKRVRLHISPSLPRLLRSRLR